MTEPSGVTASGVARTMQRLREAVASVRVGSALRPRAAIVLDTRLGVLTEHVEAVQELPYDDIPEFPRPTGDGHAGRLLLGHVEGVPTVLLQGRAHRFEGYDLEEVAFPVRVARMLGAGLLVVTGLCRAVNPLWAAGDLVLLDDHINLTGENPLTGPNLDELGPRFPDMSEPYDRELQRWAMAAALARGIPLRRGVYVGVTGPSLETRAEYRMLRTLGADVVGMSVVPEVIVARHMGMRVLGLGIVSDLCLPDALEPAEAAASVRTARQAEPGLTRLVLDVVGRLSSIGSPDADDPDQTATARS